MTPMMTTVVVFLQGSYNTRVLIKDKAEASAIPRHQEQTACHYSSGEQRPQVQGAGAGISSTGHPARAKHDSREGCSLPLLP